MLAANSDSLTGTDPRLIVPQTATYTPTFTAAPWTFKDIRNMAWSLFAGQPNPAVICQFHICQCQFSKRATQ